MAVRAIIGLLLAATLMGGCVQPIQNRAEGFSGRLTGSRILMMPPIVEVSELTAGGLLEPKADWTETAKQHVDGALAAAFAERNAEIKLYQPPTDPEREQLHVQLQKLHDVVAGAILVHHYQPVTRLPNKQGKLDWSLGEGVRTLHGDSGADFALFTVFRDAHASPGRIVRDAAIIMLSLGRVIPAGAPQVVVGSMVDLRTGQIVWFQRVIDPAGDLRTPESARTAAKKLLAELPL